MNTFWSRNVRNSGIGPASVVEPGTVPGQLDVDDSDLEESLDGASDDQEGVNTRNLSREYAQRTRDLIALHHELRNLGADRHIDIPRIVVIGAQSVGKSSLVEAVSGISVPRDSGTCTRCPMECNLFNTTESWSCRISLRLEAQSKTIYFGPTITNRNHVDLWIRRAQAAILSPDSNFTEFYDKNLQELRDALRMEQARKFSQDVVVVDIYDPDAVELCFVDLPGLVQNSDLDQINLVLNLVKSYIRQEKTLILVAVPMSDDIENHQAFLLARMADPEGKRTIGVLTKPDMLVDGATEDKQRWQRVLKGDEHVLKHGYYAIRLPNDAERQGGITPMQVNRQSVEFFNQTSPWKEMMDRRRFGIPNFVKDISQILVKLMENAFPLLMQQVEDKLTQVKNDINELPRLPTMQPIPEIITRVTTFCHEFNGVINGEVEAHKFVQSDRGCYEDLQRELQRTVPDFRPFELPQRYEKLTFEDDELDAAAVVPISDPYGLLDVRKIIQGSITWELKHNVPFSVNKELIQKFIGLWRDPAMNCFQAVFTHLSEMMDELLNKHFGQFRRLECHIHALLRVELNEHKGLALQTLCQALDREMSPLYTQNDRYLDSLRDKWLKRYRYARQNPHQHRSQDSETASTIASSRGYQPVRSRCPVEPPSHEENALRELALAGYGNPTVESLAALRPPDIYEQELIVMADVRAYFQVAYKRIIDVLPMTIEHSLNRAFVITLQDRILPKLFPEDVDSNGLAELMSEDPHIAAKREILQTKYRQLENIRERLLAFPSA